MHELIFDEAEYLAANPDVALAIKEGVFRNGFEHYKKYGKKEGRLLKPIAIDIEREQKIFHLINKNGQGLEIGPSYSPIAPKKKGFNVQVLDIATADQLRSKYLDHETYGVKIENIEKVDFVWHGESLCELIGKTECYDWIISSHVVEHIPDLISHFQQCQSLLKPTGILSLVIPDKRFCFDYHSPITSTGNLLDAYIAKRKRPTPGQTFDYIANSIKRNGRIAWSSDQAGGTDSLIHTSEQAKDYFYKALDSEEYIDIHCWRFTPSSFRLLISDLINLGLISIEIKADFGTSGCEFYVSLGKTKDTHLNVDRLANLQKILDENVLSEGE